MEPDNLFRLEVKAGNVQFDPNLAALVLVQIRTRKLELWMIYEMRRQRVIQSIGTWSGHV